MHDARRAQILTNGGQKLGQRVDDLLVCRNDNGVGHRAAEHPVIVSVDVVQDMAKRFKGRYGFEPILDVKSPTGRRIIQLSQKLHCLSSLK